MFKVRTAIIALGLIAGTVAGPAVASADPGRAIDATFTKWVVGDTVGGPDADLFDMVGVVGGQVGNGSYFGEVFGYADDGTTTTIQAVYKINGENLSFSAPVNVTQNDATGVANITGVISGGPLDGAKVDGGYRTMSTCDIPTPGNIFGSECFKGTLHISR